MVPGTAVDVVRIHLHVLDPAGRRAVRHADARAVESAREIRDAMTVGRMASEVHALPGVRDVDVRQPAAGTKRADRPRIRDRRGDGLLGIPEGESAQTGAGPQRAERRGVPAPASPADEEHRAAAHRVMRHGGCAAQLDARRHDEVAAAVVDACRQVDRRARPLASRRVERGLDRRRAVRGLRVDLGEDDGVALRTRKGHRLKRDPVRRRRVVAHEPTARGRVDTRLLAAVAQADRSLRSQHERSLIEDAGVEQRHGIELRRTDEVRRIAREDRVIDGETDLIHLVRRHRQVAVPDLALGHHTVHADILAAAEPDADVVIVDAEIADELPVAARVVRADRAPRPQEGDQPRRIRRIRKAAVEPAGRRDEDVGNASDVRRHIDEEARPERADAHAPERMALVDLGTDADRAPAVDERAVLDRLVVAGRADCRPDRPRIGLGRLKPLVGIVEDKARKPRAVLERKRRRPLLVALAVDDREHRRLRRPRGRVIAAQRHPAAQRERRVDAVGSRREEHGAAADPGRLLDGPLDAHGVARARPGTEHAFGDDNVARRMHGPHGLGRRRLQRAGEAGETDQEPAPRRLPSPDHFLTRSRTSCQAFSNALLFVWQ